MKNQAICAAALLAVVATVATADELWNNGPLVTHPGAGAGGADVSMASLVPNTAGSNVTTVVRRADDFTVGGPGWIVSKIETFAYDTNNPTPRWDSALITIHSGSPDGPIAASANATWELSGINRIFNGEANLGNTARQLSRITADFGSIELGAGDYWMVLSITHSAGVNSWFPFVMDINPADPNDPITRVGNSQVSTDSGATWALGSVSTGGWNQSPEMAFVVRGEVIPAPGAIAALGFAGLAASRRRR